MNQYHFLKMLIGFMFSCLYANFEICVLLPSNSTLKTFPSNPQICLSSHLLENPQMHPFLGSNQSLNLSSKSPPQNPQLHPLFAAKQP